jgi:hypothetical protein
VVVLDTLPTDNGSTSIGFVILILSRLKSQTFRILDGASISGYMNSLYASWAVVVLAKGGFHEDR